MFLMQKNPIFLQYVYIYVYICNYAAMRQCVIQMSMLFM